jgi:hypothetical protein
LRILRERERKRERLAIMSAAGVVNDSLHIGPPVPGIHLHHKKPEEKAPVGPLREILSYQDRLYKHITWEDPASSLGSFLITLSVLVGVHYIPFTRWLIKVTAIVLGVVSAVEGANQAFGPNTILSRLRPTLYRTIPEHTLNTALQYVHVLTQVAVVQAQRILYCEDLPSTFTAFVGLTVTYFLLKVASPFVMTLLGLVSLYTVPLAWSLRGGQTHKETQQLPEESAGTKADRSKTLASIGMTEAEALDHMASNRRRSLTQDNKAEVGTSGSAKDHQMGDAVSYATSSAYQLSSGARPSRAAGNTPRLFDSTTDPAKAHAGLDLYSTPRSTHSHLDSGLSSESGHESQASGKHAHRSEGSVNMGPKEKPHQTPLPAASGPGGV